MGHWQPKDQEQVGMRDAQNAGSSLAYLFLILAIGVGLGIAGTLTLQAEQAKTKKAEAKAHAIVVTAAAETAIATTTQSVATAAKDARHEIASKPPIFTVKLSDDGPISCTPVEPGLVWRSFADRYNRVRDAAGGATVEPDPVRSAAPRSE